MKPACGIRKDDIDLMGYCILDRVKKDCRGVSPLLVLDYFYPDTLGMHIDLLNRTGPEGIACPDNNRKAILFKEIPDFCYRGCLSGPVNTGEQDPDRVLMGIDIIDKIETLPRGPDQGPFSGQTGQRYQQVHRFYGVSRPVLSLNLQ